ncbi:hypothetical protein H0H93_008517 [Arthromyces matolae]|nr:hypothetical protein H0H93_008517 [Arthromyces matolae]
MSIKRSIESRTVESIQFPLNDDVQSWPADEFSSLVGFIPLYLSKSYMSQPQLQIQAAQPPLPWDVLERILFQLNICDVLKVASAFPATRKAVDAHIYQTIERAFKLLGLDAEHMLSLLGETGSIVSGSFVLMLLNPWTFVANDVDIYVPIDQADTVVEKMSARYNLKLISQPQNPEWTLPDPNYDDLPYISRVLKYGQHKDSISVNIIESSTSNPLRPIFGGFHSSVVMNYLAGSEIYCAYPDLTFSWRNLLSTRRYKRIKDDAAPLKTFRECVKKYQDRGYQYTHLEKGWCAGYWHVCRNDPSCPSTIRDVHDGHGFRYVIRMKDGTKEVPRFQLNLRDLRNVAAVSQVLRDIVHQHVKLTTERAFQLVGLDAKHILPLLRDTNSVISGSFVLLLLNPWTFIPHDVDIYVPGGKTDQVIEEICRRYDLTLIGKTPTPEWDTANEYVDVSHIRRVFAYGRDGVSVNIIESFAHYPLAPIGPINSFHSTAVMNFLSGYEIYCAYPNLTFNFQNLLSTKRYIRSQDRKTEMVNFKACIKKYRERGYPYSHVDMGWCDSPGHQCYSDPSCPHTYRHIYDGHGFRYFLHGLAPNTTTNVPVFREVEMWNLIEEDL